MINRPSPISSLLHRDLQFRNVIINLADSPERKFDVIGGDPMCAHLSKKDDRCTKCGAYFGKLGHEKDPLLYHKHVDLLANSFTESDDVYIISDRMFMEDYHIPVFGMSLANFKGFRHRRVYTVHNRVNPTRRKSPGSKVKYVIHYTDDTDSFLNNTFIYSKSMDLVGLLADSSDLLIVNPTKRDLKYYHGEYTFSVPDSSIMVLLDSLHVRSPIRLLR